MSQTKPVLQRQVGRRAVSTLRNYRSDVMTLSEAADWLRLPADEVSRLAGLGDLPGQQVGREWRFLRSVLQSWLSMRTECRRSSAGR